MTENPNQQALAAVDGIAQIKRAQEGLERMRRESADWFAVKAVLDAAEQEAEAWAAIDQWQAAKPQSLACHVEFIGPYDGARLFQCRLHRPTGLAYAASGSTRLAALSKTAEFCRKELSK